MKKVHIGCDIQICRPEELDVKDRTLSDKAIEVAALAYAPYSEFQVGAAVMLDNGRIVTGNNQENVSYPCGICAERVALFSAATLYPQSSIDTLVVVALVKDGCIASACPPCGLCRQVILESEKRQQGKPIRILLYGAEECIVIADGAKALLPIQFDEKAFSR